MRSSIGRRSSIDSERVGRLKFLFNLSLARQSLYIALDAAKSLPVLSHEIDNVTPPPKIFVRVAILPTSFKDLENVASVMFRSVSGARMRKEIMRGRSVLHPAAEEVMLHEV